MGYIEIDSVTKKYPGKLALRDVSINLEKGTLLSVVGPSGSGKTTLLRLINGFEFPDSGSIRIGDIQLTEKSAPQIRRGIAMVFQSPTIFNASVYENVAYSLKFRGISGSELQSRVLDMLGLVQLVHLAGRNALTLSGGESQRVALARALVYDPTLILLDEPTANLDPTNSLIIERVLNEENKKGKTIVLVTHNIFQARRLARRVAFLLEGKLVEVQDNERFFTAPKDERTRHFIDGDLVY